MNIFNILIKETKAINLKISKFRQKNKFNSFGIIYTDFCLI